jgi:hypothetical protein
MSDSIATDVRAPIGTRLYPRWHQRPAIRYQGTVRQLRRVLPRFERRSGFQGKHEIIGKSPWKPDRQIIVGSVSPQYVLVQHEEFLDVLAAVMSEEGYDLENMPGILTTTNYGERMELTVEMTAFANTPSDGYPLECRLRCLNSVDATTALEAELQWYRKICSNGMFGWKGDSVRHIHRYNNAMDWLKDRLARRFEDLPNDRLYFSQLMDIPVSDNNLKDWVDVFIARQWSRFDAARTYQICMTGRDGYAFDYDDDRAAHELEFRSGEDVPGACAPARNVYHVGQALSWVAGTAGTVEKQFSQTSAIPKLLRHLLK